MGYWRTVFERAAREAAKDVRLDSAVAVVMLLIGQAIIGAGVFWGMGQLTDANVWTRAMTGLLPFVAYPLALGIRMVTVPPAMTKEAAAKIAALEAAAGAQTDKRAAFRARLQEYFSTAGRHFGAVKKLAGIDDLSKAAAEWDRDERQMFRWLRDNASTAAAEKLRMPGPGSLTDYPWPAVDRRYATQRSNLLGSIQDRMANLQEMLERGGFDPA